MTIHHHLLLKFDLKSYDTENYTLNKTKSKDKPASIHMELAYVLKTDCDCKKWVHISWTCPQNNKLHNSNLFLMTYYN